MAAERRGTHHAQAAGGAGSGSAVQAVAGAAAAAVSPGPIAQRGSLGPSPPRTRRVRCSAMATERAACDWAALRRTALLDLRDVERSVVIASSATGHGERSQKQRTHLFWTTRPSELHSSSQAFCRGSPPSACIARDCRGRARQSCMKPERSTAAQQHSLIRSPCVTLAPRTGPASIAAAAMRPIVPASPSRSPACSPSKALAFAGPPSTAAAGAKAAQAAPDEPQASWRRRAAGGNAAQRALVR